MARTKAAATAPTNPPRTTRSQTAGLATRSQAAGTAPRTAPAPAAPTPAAAPAAPSDPPRNPRPRTAGKAPRTTPAPVARPAARPAPAPAPAEEDDEFISEATYQRAEAQPKLLVTIPMADGRVKIFGGKYSGQTMYDPATGKKYKPGVGSTAYYVKQAENAARKAQTAPERLQLTPESQQPLINLKMATSNPYVMNEAFRSNARQARVSHSRDGLATVGRTYGQDYPDGAGPRNYVPRAAPGQRDTFTRYGRRPRVLPEYGHVRTIPRPAVGDRPARPTTIDAIAALGPNEPVPEALLRAARVRPEETARGRVRRQVVAAAAR